MLFSKPLQALSVGLSLVNVISAVSPKSGTSGLTSRQQDIVTWDDHSLFVNGERLMLFSGEFHAFRLPVKSLWLDILQKMKASGYNCVSIYINWHLIEGKRGEFRADGIFALEPFFAAAKKAGIYVLPRPGPYINAEVAGGGFPGWLTRLPGKLRTSNPEYIKATDLYTHEIGRIIAEAQITNGGPVVLFQLENEYQSALDGEPMPDFTYWDLLDAQFRNAGVIVPYINNESYMAGFITANTTSSVDIYGHDAYPLGFDCENPSIWPKDGLPTNWLEINNRLAPDTPYTIPEFQGGGFQNWGDAGFDNCALLLNMEFERVLYKNNYAVGVTIFNIYMTFGGTNWGNLGHGDGYTSYDYGAQITEERQVWREKYSEVKLQANFFHVSPAYLEADRFNPSLNFTDNPAITVTPATTKKTKFYISRHSKYDTTDSVPYRLTVNTVDYGDIEIPQIGESLFLNRRDSKIHFSDYAVGDEHLIYSSAEVFTWKKYDDKTVLVLYGGPNEHHEIAVKGKGSKNNKVLEGNNVEIQQAKEGYTIVSWDVLDDVQDRKVVKINDSLYIYLLNRNEAYNFWVPPTGSGSDFGTSDVILKAGYLVRTAQKEGKTLSLVGDVNATTPIEIIGGAPDGLKELKFNGASLDFEQNHDGIVTATVDFLKPGFSLPCLSQLKWKTIDSLPELSEDYDDSDWLDANFKESPNDKQAILTPVSLFAGDYGFHTGSVIFRGHFTANGAESTLNLTMQGGHAYGASIWLGAEFLGSWIGDPVLYVMTSTLLQLPPELKEGTEHILTIVIDLMGLDGSYVIGDDHLKTPRGIIDYELAGHDASDIKWKIQGNLGGENYQDLTRGPLNEGAFYAERQGYHQPSPPSALWESGKPTDAISKAGISFYTTTFDLDLPKGYDIPLAFKFGRDVPEGGSYRLQLFVNGYQFGKFVPHIGPQWRYPVPEGILNYHGSNTLAMTIWAMEEGGAKLPGMGWDVSNITATGFDEIELSEAPEWAERDGGA